MTGHHRVAQALAAGLLVVVSSVAFGGVRAGAAAAVPSDPSAAGFVGLCDQHNHNVTSGTVGSTPFVWKAVASKPPPAQYLGQGQNAVLNIFQPRPGVPAADWSGDQLTGTTLFTTKSAPSVQATYKDIPLSVIVREYPPLVNGLYELRMYFGKINYGLYSATYPATFIRVSGSHWSVVSGATVNCAASSGQSTEVMSGAVPARVAYGAASPQPPVGRPSSAPLRSGASSHAQSPVADTSDGSTGTGNDSPAAAHGGSSNSVAWWIATAAIAVAAAAGLGWLRVRRRNA